MAIGINPVYLCPGFCGHGFSVSGWNRLAINPLTFCERVPEMQAEYTINPAFIA
jgi:hypothetical protein